MGPAAPAVTGVARRAGQKRRAWVAAAALLALAAGTLVASPAAGQTTTGTEVRIVARQLSSGTVEFGLQQRQADDPWGFHHSPGCGTSPPAPKSTAGSGARHWR